ncbi:MAG: DUF3562 domain-containing protein [Candidatus Manganitrophaceae bacterium]
MVVIEYDAEEKEKARHQSAIRMLSRDLGIPAHEIGALYEGVLEELKRTARVKDYLPILASRQVRDLLHNKNAA